MTWTWPLVQERKEALEDKTIYALTPEGESMLPKEI